MSGAPQVAVIDFICHCTSPNLSVTAGVSGTVAILDPAVVNGGSVDTGSATILGGRHGVDVSQIAFGAQTTLAYAETGGTLTVGQRPPCCRIALLGNYMAEASSPRRMATGTLSPRRGRRDSSRC